MSVGICLPCGVSKNHDRCTTRTGEAHIGCDCPVCGPSLPTVSPYKAEPQQDINTPVTSRPDDIDAQVEACLARRQET